MLAKAEQKTLQAVKPTPPIITKMGHFRAEHRKKNHTHMFGSLSILLMTSAHHIEQGRKNERRRGERLLRVFVKAQSHQMMTMISVIVMGHIPSNRKAVLLASKVQQSISCDGNEG